MPTRTLEKLADTADRRAESRNSHDIVGCHRLLAAILHRRVGREHATAIMRAIVKLGGLDGMNGAGGTTAAYEALGVPRPWHTWTLPDEP